MLETVRYLDPNRGLRVEAFTDGYAYDNDLRVYLLSASGCESAVKGVTSALTTGLPVEVVSDGSALELRRAYLDSYNVLNERLPSGLLHQLVLSERFVDSEAGRSRLVYVPGGSDESSVLFEAIKEGYPVPAIEGWAGWLCERMENAGFLTRLHGNRTVYRLSASEDALDGLIAEGVKRGEIEF